MTERFGQDIVGVVPCVNGLSRRFHDTAKSGRVWPSSFSQESQALLWPRESFPDTPVTLGPAPNLLRPRGCLLLSQDLKPKRLIRLRSFPVVSMPWTMP